MSDLPQDATEKLIRDGERIGAFLDDSAVKDAIERVRAALFLEFKSTTSHEATVGVWAQARALDLVMQRLRADKDAAHVEKVRRDRENPSRAGKK